MKGGTEVSQGKCACMEDQFQKLRTWRTMEGRDKLSLQKKNRKGGKTASLRAKTWFKGEKFKLDI